LQRVDLHNKLLLVRRDDGEARLNAFADDVRADVGLLRVVLSQRLQRGLQTHILLL
jgi:hypothetical protein